MTLTERIRFTRQPDGTYVRTGDLPKGTRYATVIISNGNGLGAVKKASEWIETLERGPLKQEWYEVVPAASPKGAMSDEAKEKLAEINRRKKEERQIRD